MPRSSISTSASATCSSAPTPSCGCAPNGCSPSDRKADIRFNYTEGKRLSFASRRDTDYAAFRKYMDYVFAYAGTYSLERELKPVPLASLQIGDVFIKGGFPGHAVLVADVAENATRARSAFCWCRATCPRSRCTSSRTRPPPTARRGIRQRLTESSSRPSGRSPPTPYAVGLEGNPAQ